jgi:hypothetical protein
MAKRMKQMKLDFTTNLQCYEQISAVTVSPNITDVSDNISINCELQNEPNASPMQNSISVNDASALVSKFCDMTEHSDAIQVPVLNDIACAIELGVSVTPLKRYELLTNHWVPSEDYIFPVSTEGSRKRRFQLQWLKRFTWLAYSPSLSGCLCKVSILHLNFF